MTMRMQSCTMCFSRNGLRSAIAFEAEKGYRNALDGNMRFSHFLISKIQTICSRSKHTFTKRILDEVDDYGISSISDRSKVLDKVSVLMGYDSLHDLIESERAGKHCGMYVKDAMDFDVSSVCKLFPSITLGSSPPIDLYDGTTSFSEKMMLATQIPRGLPSVSTGEEQERDSLYETGDSLYPAFPRVETPSTLTTDENTDQPSPLEDHSNNVALQSQKGVVSDGLFMDSSISCIPGISKRRLSQLQDCGFHTVRKLLHHFPRTYADLQNVQTEIDDGQYLIFIGKILRSRGIKAGASFSFVEVVVGCELGGDKTPEHQNDSTDSIMKKTIFLHLKKFFKGARFTSLPFLRMVEQKHKEGDCVCVSGKVRTMPSKDHYEMREYNIDVLKDGNDLSYHARGRPYPIYPSKGGLNPDIFRDIAARVMQVLPINIDPIPTSILLDFGLPNLHDAYTGIHQPESMSAADLARKRLIFDEFFYLQLGRLYQMLEGLGTHIEKDALLDKYRKPESSAAYMEEWSSLTKKFLKALPYALTGSQLTAVSEIIWDLKQPVPMNRILQGDVGCGKTVVAFLACMEVIASGYQAAFMVPTELLAIQHYEHLNNLLEMMGEGDCKPSIALLTGSTPLKQSRMIQKSLQSGEVSMIIGTTSLIADRVEFSALRIAVIDEQHRFGVVQRGQFNSKLYYTSISSKMLAKNSDETSKDGMHMAPHVLAMSATPIPRTLALALYGDMSLTQITELPPGRIPVETIIIEGNDSGFEDAYEMMLDELKGGGKVYLVYPVIKQSEQLPQLRAASVEFEAISHRFQGYSCGLLHGKMKSDEKDEALRKFRSGETNILLSTQVIEIGVDIPDASMMVVMNAERFGIAQLHQLRGRVGRGVRKSKCILLASSESSLRRLKFLGKSSDGFYLANMDLLLRGPGNLLGKKQSGHLPEFPIARLEVDGNILQEAHLAALKILGESHDLEQFPFLKAELSMRQPLSILGD